MDQVYTDVDVFIDVILNEVSHPIKSRKLRFGTSPMIDVLSMIGLFSIYVLLRVPGR